MPAHICASCINWVESPDERLCSKCKKIPPANIAPLNSPLPEDLGAHLLAIQRLHWPQEVPGLTNGQPLGEPPVPQYWQHQFMQPHVSHSRPDGSASGMHAAAGGPIPPVAAPQMRRDAAAAGSNSGHGAAFPYTPQRLDSTLVSTLREAEQAGRPHILGPAGGTRARTRSAVVAQAGPSSAARHVAVPPAQTPHGASASAVTSGRVRSFQMSVWAEPPHPSSHSDSLYTVAGICMSLNFTSVVA